MSAKRICLLDDPIVASGREEVPVRIRTQPVLRTFGR